MRDPHVQWCERCTPSVTTGGAAYSISGSLFFFGRASSVHSCSVMVRWLASSFYFFLLALCVGKKIKCACKCVGDYVTVWHIYLVVKSIIFQSVKSLSYL
jgi:hypothetical protein